MFISTISHFSFGPPPLRLAKAIYIKLSGRCNCLILTNIFAELTNCTFVHGNVTKKSLQSFTYFTVKC